MIKNWLYCQSSNLLSHLCLSTSDSSVERNWMSNWRQTRQPHFSGVVCESQNHTEITATNGTGNQNMKGGILNMIMIIDQIIQENMGIQEWVNGRKIVIFPDKEGLLSQMILKTFQETTGIPDLILMIMKSSPDKEILDPIILKTFQKPRGVPSQINILILMMPQVTDGFLSQMNLKIYLKAIQKMGNCWIPDKRNIKTLTGGMCR